MAHLHRLVANLIPVLGVLALERAQAQTIDYDVTILGKVPGSYITYANGLNDHGEVVGMAMFIPGGLKAWTWTESQGFALLPQQSMTRPLSPESCSSGPTRWTGPSAAVGAA